MNGGQVQQAVIRCPGDAAGNVLATYEMERVTPPGWTLAGVEVIHTIDWTGEPTQLAAAKERHTAGEAGVFDL